MNYKYCFTNKEYQDELGLNVTAMDYRQYDNAIGRFNCIDALSERNAYQSTYQFGNNNPIYFADPSGLDCTAMIQAMWDATEVGTNSYWVNDGGGNFDYAGTGSSGGSGEGGGLAGSWVSSTGEFHAPTPGIFVQLQNINCIATHNSSNWLSDVQSQVNGVSLNGIGNWENTSKEVRLNAVEPNAANTVLTLGNTLTVIDIIHGSSVGNWLRGGLHEISSISNGLKIAGNTLGAVGIYLEYKDYKESKMSGLEFGVDTVIAGAAILTSLFVATTVTVVGIPVATVAAAGALIWFGGKAIYEYSSGSTVFEKPN